MTFSKVGFLKTCSFEPTTGKEMGFVHESDPFLYVPYSDGLIEKRLIKSGTLLSANSPKPANVELYLYPIGAKNDAILAYSIYGPPYFNQKMVGWNFSSNPPQKSWELELPEAGLVDVSQDGKLIVYANYEANQLSLYSAKNGQKETTLIPKLDRWTRAQFQKNLLVISSHDGAEVWNTNPLTFQKILFSESSGDSEFPIEVGPSEIVVGLNPNHLNEPTSIKIVDWLGNELTGSPIMLGGRKFKSYDGSSLLLLEKRKKAHVWNVINKANQEILEVQGGNVSIFDGFVIHQQLSSRSSRSKSERVFKVIGMDK